MAAETIIELQISADRRDYHWCDPESGVCVCGTFDDRSYPDDFIKLVPFGVDINAFVSSLLNTKKIKRLLAQRGLTER